VSPGEREVRDETIILRPAGQRDVDFLVEANVSMARETEGRDLDQVVVRRGVERALAERDKGRYFVAQIAGRNAGCLLVTLEWSDWRDGWFWWIQSVWVDPAARGRGVYTALHEHVRGAARAAGDVVGLRLYVERENERAQRTYSRLGMEPTRYLVFEERLEG